MSDRSTFCGEIKTKAKAIVEHHYHLFPTETIPGQSEYMEAIIDAVKHQLTNSKFLRAEQLDHQVLFLLVNARSPHSQSKGRTNNLMHTAIAELCQSFYGPGKLASLFPDQFETEVPERLVALVATAVCEGDSMTHFITELGCDLILDQMLLKGVRKRLLG